MKIRNNLTYGVAKYHILGFIFMPNKKLKGKSNFFWIYFLIGSYIWKE